MLIFLMQVGLVGLLFVIGLILAPLSGTSKKGRKKGSMRSPKNGKWLW